VMATAASSLFMSESFAANMVPKFREGLGRLQAFFERIIEQTFGVPEGSWIGTPTNLNRERESGELERRMPNIRHEHLVLWGEKDGWIPPADLKAMATAMPNSRLVIVPGIGHSMNLEMPELYAGYFGAWFGGLAR
jgi:non-heme chloroperoxidase